MTKPLFVNVIGKPMEIDLFEELSHILKPDENTGFRVVENGKSVFLIVHETPEREKLLELSRLIKEHEELKNAIVVVHKANENLINEKALIKDTEMSKPYIIQHHNYKFYDSHVNRRKGKKDTRVFMPQYKKKR